MAAEVTANVIQRETGFLKVVDDNGFPQRTDEKEFPLLVPKILPDAAPLGGKGATERAEYS